MTTRILAAMAIVAGSLVVTACGQSNTPEAGGSVQPTPAAQAPVQPVAPPTQTLAPVPTVTAAIPALAGAVPAEVASVGKSDKLIIQGFASQVPASWTPSQPSSTMRVAQFSLPPAAGADVGELAAYFFPTGQGGSHEANIERWASQFVGADGKPVAPKTSIGKSGNTDVTVVELHGTYARGVGMGPTGDAKPNQTLMIAMVETSVGRITLQMYGPSKTVSAHRELFLKFAKGFRPA